MIVVIKETEEYMSTFSISSIGERIRNELSKHSLSSSNSGYFWQEIDEAKPLFLFISLFFSIISITYLNVYHGNGESTKRKLFHVIYFNKYKKMRRYEKL